MRSPRKAYPFVAGVLAAAMIGGAADGATTTALTYDALGRVVSATYSDGLKITYSYDAAGNRTQQVVTGPPVAHAVAQAVAVNSSNDPITLNISGSSATSVAVATNGSHGTATASGTAITYTPNASYTGVDTFQYTATNASGASAPAAATITVQ